MKIFLSILRVIFVSAAMLGYAEEGAKVDYEQLKIKSYKHWDVYLHENQCYLGRVFVLLKSDEA